MNMLIKNVHCSNGKHEKLLILYEVGDPNSVRQQVQFWLVARERSRHSQIIK